MLSHTPHWWCYCFCYNTFSLFPHTNVLTFRVIYAHFANKQSRRPRTTRAACSQIIMSASFFLVRTHISSGILMQFNALLVIFMLVYELIIQAKWRWSGRVCWPHCQTLCLTDAGLATQTPAISLHFGAIHRFQVVHALLVVPENSWLARSEP